MGAKSASINIEQIKDLAEANAIAGVEAKVIRQNAQDEVIEFSQLLQDSRSLFALNT